MIDWTWTSIRAASITGTLFHSLFEIGIALEETGVVVLTLERTLSKGELVIVATKNEVLVAFWIGTNAQWMETINATIWALVKARTGADTRP